MEVSAMASMMVIFREGHLSTMFQMFSFLKNKHNGVTSFDPSDPEIEITQFPTEDWSTKTYSPYKEEVPYDAPASRGIEFNTRAFSDSDHAVDILSRLSRN